jgi:hypothetical protein
MATPTPTPTLTELMEDCPACGHETSHTVRIEIRTESTKPENRAYSREPYRLSVCQRCGCERSERMNDA